jgi:branched-chain amino acid transport system permease protein
MYVISGAVAGAGGALTAVTTGVVGLDGVSFEWSAAALVMLVLGGSNLYGALIGTVAYMSFEHIVSAANPFHWLTIVGAMLIAVVLVLPEGLQALPGRILRRMRAVRP